jgi:3',5'-cyclic AMP phosphodiesterase CpdA
MLLSTKIPQNVEVFEPEIEKKNITIGLISDTHIPTRADKLPEKVSEIFKDVDFIIHSGDFVSLSVAEELEKIAPLYAVQGNMDFQEIREKYPKFAIDSKSLQLHDRSLSRLLKPSETRGYSKKVWSERSSFWSYSYVRDKEKRNDFHKPRKSY